MRKKVLTCLVMAIALFGLTGQAWATTIKDDMNYEGEHKVHYATIEFVEAARASIPVVQMTSTVGTDNISATNITDVVRYENIALNTCNIGSTGLPIGTRSVSSPSLTIRDSVPVIWWDASDVQATIQLPSFVVPSIFVSGLTWRLQVSASLNTTSNSTAPRYGWAIRHQASGEVFATTGYPSYLLQTGVETPYKHCTVGTVYITLTPNAAAINRIADGDLVTVSIWNDFTKLATMDYEIKGIERYFTATQ